MFRIPGIILEVRELKSKTNETWRGYLLKVATLGATFEIDADFELWKRQTAGKPCTVVGRMEDNKGIIRLRATDVLGPGGESETPEPATKDAKRQTQAA